MSFLVTYINALSQEIPLGVYDDLDSAINFVRDYSKKVYVLEYYIYTIRENPLKAKYIDGKLLIS